MNIWDFLQWFSVGGVTILSVFITSRNSSKNNEHQFIDQLQEELKRNSDRLDQVTKRLDDLENENSTLKELNYKLQIERDNAIVAKVQITEEKNAIERELMIKIDSLGVQNKELKERVSRLEKNGSKNN